VGSFITGTELETIRDEGWEAFESVTIREYAQGAKDKLNKETVEMSGIPGQIPKMVVRDMLVPVLEAGIASWTLRNLSNEEIARLYEAQAKTLSKNAASLNIEEKCEAVKDVPIVPLTREWISKLKSSYAKFIAQEIRRLNPEMTSAERRDFLRRIRAKSVAGEAAV
jgi:hypothetical protein